ncbi:MAG: hypothetical protein II096_03975, partial [Erysipelotrichaceae bacterium]|nr:hypothetical protein [Erysipelotrichaceae bacterium]
MRKKSTLAAILSLLMVLVMAVSMTGCVSKNQNDKTDSGKDSSVTEDTASTDQSSTENQESKTSKEESSKKDESS